MDGVPVKTVPFYKKQLYANYGSNEVTKHLIAYNNFH